MRARRKLCRNTLSNCGYNGYNLFLCGLGRLKFRIMYEKNVLTLLHYYVYLSVTLILKIFIL